MSPVNVPFNLLEWIDEHRAEFEGPVSNKVVWADSDFIYMVIRGPNARNDFHVDPGDEIFMQLRGDVRVDIIDDAGVRHERRIREGEVMLVPGGTPHAPLRPADTWGLVIERPRAADEVDELRWYCDCCGALVHSESLHMADIETQLRAALERVNASVELRTCAECGCVVPLPEPFAWGADDEGAPPS